MTHCFLDKYAAANTCSCHNMPISLHEESNLICVSS